VTWNEQFVDYMLLVHEIKKTWFVFDKLKFFLKLQTENLNKSQLMEATLQTKRKQKHSILHTKIIHMKIKTLKCKLYLNKCKKNDEKQNKMYSRICNLTMNVLIAHNLMMMMVMIIMIVIMLMMIMMLSFCLFCLC
jgi:hypothetical protein